MTFDGAVFEGTRTLQSGDYLVDTHIRGVVEGYEPGARVLVEVWGNMDKPLYQEVYALGVGTVTESETLDDGRIVVRFTGPVSASKFLNDQGVRCEMVDPNLSQTVGNEIARLEFKP